MSRKIRFLGIQVIRSNKSTGVILICCTILSLLFANSFIGDQYIRFLEMDNKRLHIIGLPSNIKDWINDGCMAIFFLVAGMEIKKEILVGELSSRKKAMLPLFAAIGGVLAPALIYLLCNKGTAFQNGWGIPTATDIAFSIGIMSMLGKKYVPFSLKVFLTALAIIDDLIAILLVAFFYGGVIHWIWLLVSLGLILLLFVLFKRESKSGFFHVFIGILLWYSMLQSGIHATIAGVVYSFLIPLDSMPKWEKVLQMPVNFVIIPIFAIANTCIPLTIGMHELFHSPLFWGISIGLFLGKVIGISLTSFLLVKFRWVSLPTKTTPRQFVGAGLLAGIGFTMSIFIVSIAFTNNTEWQEIAKIAILTGSFLSMITGYVWLRFISINKK